MQKGENNMGRANLTPVKDRTTIVTNKTLLDRIGLHVARKGDNQTSFITRALVNQLEREGDLEIRVKIVVPDELGYEAIKLYEKLKEINS